MYNGFSIHVQKPGKQKTAHSPRTLTGARSSVTQLVSLLQQYLLLWLVTALQYAQDLYLTLEQRILDLYFHLKTSSFQSEDARVLS